MGEEGGGPLLAVRNEGDLGMNEMQLVSIPDEDFPDFNALLSLEPKLRLRRIWAISAYYDHESIKQLIRYMKDHGAVNANLELIIVLDRRARIDEDIKKLDKKIRRKFGSSSSGIYLSSSGELFHSKGYLVESQKIGKCAVGSLNLTHKGLTKNKELLASCDYRINSKSYTSKFAKNFKEYVKEILSDKDTYRASEAIRVSSRINRRDFFIEDRLYYEANEIGPFGFKLSLPDDVRTGPSIIIPDLEAKTSDVLDVRNLIDLELEQIKRKEKKSKNLWKRYCFQTCYGYWAPECHFEDIKIEIEKNEDLVEIYENTFCALEEKSEELWSELLKRCRILAPKVGNNWKFLSEDSQVLDEEKLGQKWSAWFCNLMRKKRDKLFISRLCRDIQSVKMPDIWADGEAVKDFEDSFKQSFCYESNKNKSNNKLLRLLEEHGANDGSLKELIYDWLHT